MLETAWKVEPQPDIADAYAMVRPGDSVRDRLKRMRRLAEIRANHAEGSMAVARAAIDAGDFAAARAALEGLAKAPTERVCLLMAEIEEREHGDQGKVRAWLTRALTAPRDPAWVADGQVLDRWLPVSPVTGRVGAAEWRVPPQGPASRTLAAIEAGPLDEPVASVDPLPVPRIESRVAPIDEPPEPPADIDMSEVGAGLPGDRGDAGGTAGSRRAAAPPPATATADPVPPAAPPPAPAPAAAAVAAPAPAAPAEAQPAAPAFPAVSRVPSVAAEAAEPPQVEADAPLVPHAPDDPGPLPPDPEDVAARRRFRLF